MATQEEEEVLTQAVARSRMAVSMGEPVPWDAPVPDWLDVTQLHHLPPPAGREPDADQVVRKWRAAYRPGLYAFRVGPGFIDVKDVRDLAHAARIRVDQPLLVEALMLCDQPVRMVEQDAARQAAIEFLVSKRLVLRFSDLAITAPYRTRRWPIPTRIGQ